MSRIEVVLGDIVSLQVDAIVNAANKYLLRGSGVCGAIHAAAGPELEYECIKLAPCETGKSVVTGAYRLLAKYVIHTVGPIYQRNPELAPMMLKAAYESALRLARENEVRSIAFPCISTGVYGYPKEAAAEIAVGVVREFLLGCEMRVIFCCYDEESFEIYQGLLP